MPQQYTLPTLAYAFDALEPVLSKELLEVHYSKHHASYVANLNKALEQLEAAEKKEDLVQQIALHEAIRFNGGGHINHSLYWENLTPRSKGGGDLPKGRLSDELIQEFMSIEKMQGALSQKAASVQGSGWAWLGFHPERRRIEIEITPIHDLLRASKGLVPLLCIDMWEHAYYLTYKNVKSDYLKNIWSLVNWKVVEDRFQKAVS